MAVVKEGQAPYAPAPAVLGVIEGYRTKHPQTPFTTENIQLLGVSSSLAPRTLQALQLLDLLDDEGEPTAAMQALREAHRKDYPNCLGEVLRTAYSEVFHYRDPATNSPEDIGEVFRFYRPPSMQARMVRLFYGLCEAANIIDAAPTIARDSNGSAPKRPVTPSRAKAKAKANGKAKEKEKEKSPKPERIVPPRTGSSPENGLPEILGALVARLPRKGAPPMTADEARWWLDMVEMALPREYGFDAVPPKGSAK